MHLQASDAGAIVTVGGLSPGHAGANSAPGPGVTGHRQPGVGLTRATRARVARRRTKTITASLTVIIPGLIATERDPESALCHAACRQVSRSCRVARRSCAAEEIAAAGCFLSGP